jgi:hypothetical protein
VRRSIWGALAAALALPSALAWSWSASGCGTEITYRRGAEGGGGEGDRHELGGGGSFPITTSSGIDAGADGFDPWVDTPCEDQPPPIEDYACDPYAQGNGDCLEGDACYIYVQYPTEPCGQEIYGASCLPEGVGGQGAPCAGPMDCGGGHVCVVTGSGTQCVQYCRLEGPSGCPSGLVCEPIDVEGFGGCL